jgi:aspartate racemase
MPKTIGVLGGMGTYATLHFLQYLADLSEPDEFRFILDNNVDITERTRAVKNGLVNSVALQLELAIGGIARAGANFVVMPCNQVHYWHRDTFSFIPWLDMIEIVSNSVVNRGFSSPLILGGYVTIAKKLYSKYLPDAVYLPSKENEKIYQAIVAIKRYKAMRFNAKMVVEGVVEKRADKCDSVILACTELSLVFDGLDKQGVSNLPIFDSSLELAKATIQYARGENGE